MQKIDSAAFDKLVGKIPVRRERNEKVSELLKLHVGEGAVIFKREWELKSTPASALSSYAIRLERKFQQKELADGSGWAVLRIL